jgi:uncharacterized membrane protein
MNRIITAFILGLSVERLFICPFLTFGLALSEKRAAVRFLLGRILGLVSLGLLFSLIGFKAFPISKNMVNIIFGILVVFFGIIIFLRKQGKEHRRLDGHSGFGFGLFRGMLTPGRKMIILFPLLIGVSIPEGLIISITYALSSSFYLILGFMGGEVLSRAFSHRRIIKIVGALILIGLGLFYIGKGLGLFCMGKEV